MIQTAKTLFLSFLISANCIAIPNSFANDATSESFESLLEQANQTILHDRNLTLANSPLSLPTTLSPHAKDIIQAEPGKFLDDAPPFVPKRHFHLNSDKLYDLAKIAVAKRIIENQTLETFFDELVASIKAEYPFIKTDVPWSINNTQYVAGHIKILYSTRYEYLILYGTNVENLGQSGRYAMDIRTIILDGLQLSGTEENPTVLHVHQPGDRAYLPRGTQKLYSLKPGWILECGQGQAWKSIPSLFKFNEPKNAWDQFFVSFRMSIRELFSSWIPSYFKKKQPSH